MIKFENTEVFGWEAAIRGMRNPMNSWDRSDSVYLPREYCDEDREITLAETCGGIAPIIKPNDDALMRSLANGGPVHAKYRRMITVYVDITAPLYWWKEFDTYKVGTVANSCSTMHKIHEKEFTLEDFSREHLSFISMLAFKKHIEYLETLRTAYVSAKNVDEYAGMSKKDLWWQMIQLLPSSYNQRRTIMMNYEVLANIYKWRKDHELDEWRDFCDWIESLPYSEIITGGEMVNEK